MMKKIFLLVAIIIAADACSSPFIFKFPEETIIGNGPRPEWVGNDLWKKGGFVYAVGKAERTEAGADIQLRYATIDGKRKFLKFSGACSATIVGETLLQSWTGNDGAVYALMRADKVIPWESCKSQKKRF